MFGYTRLKLGARSKAAGPWNWRWYHSRRQKEKAQAGQAPAALPTVQEVVDHDYLLEVFDRMRREKGQPNGNGIQ